MGNYKMCNILNTACRRVKRTNFGLLVQVFSICRIALGLTLNAQGHIEVIGCIYDFSDSWQPSVLKMVGRRANGLKIKTQDW